MANGWARDGAVQDQIDSTVEDAIQQIRHRMPEGKSLKRCEECGEEIPQARREAVKGVRLCILCQNEQDKQQTGHSIYNRRGSKNSQLR